MAIKTVKLNDSTYDRLKALGEAQKRTPHWLMKEAINQFLAREEAAEQIQQDTMARCANSEATGETVPHESVGA